MTERSYPVTDAPVAWRYKCQHGEFVFMEKRLTDEQKARGYYLDDDEDYDDDGDRGPFQWSDETPLYIGVAQAVQDRDETLRGLAAFFSESVHLVWSNDEIADCLTGMIGQGSSVSSTSRECQFPKCSCPGSPLDPTCAVTSTHGNTPEGK